MRRFENSPAVLALFRRLVNGRSLVTLTATNPAGRELDAVENQVRNVQMEARLEDWKRQTSAAVLRSFSWDARTGTWFEPGFAVEVDTPAGRDALLRLGAEFGQLAVYEYVAHGDAALARTVVSCDVADRTSAAAANAENVVVVPVPRPGARHPIYAYEDWYHLYHSSAAVVAFFRRVRGGPAYRRERYRADGRVNVRDRACHSGRCWTRRLRNQTRHASSPRSWTASPPRSAPAQHRSTPL